MLQIEILLAKIPGSAWQKLQRSRLMRMAVGENSYYHFLISFFNLSYFFNSAVLFSGV
jgi:hypothetical protein